MKIAITGANSSVGINLLNFLSKQPGLSIVAGVRSERAMATLPASAAIEPRRIDYGDEAGLAATLAGADCLVHLAGILIESKGTTYASANVAATAAVTSAARRAGVKHIVLVSVIGADPQSSNAYLRSKGAAERLVAESGIGASIIRTPILLGRDTAGAQSLRAMAARPQVKVLGGGHYRQRPLDIDDLNEAILKICQRRGEGVSIHELVGPEPIAYRDLLQRAAGILGGKIEVGAVPLWLARLGSAATSVFRGGGITPTVIDVITMDEVVERNADGELGITLTPLQQTLEKILKKKEA